MPSIFFVAKLVDRFERSVANSHPIDDAHIIAPIGHCAENLDVCAAAGLTGLKRMTRL